MTNDSLYGDAEELPIAISRTTGMVHDKKLMVLAFPIGTYGYSAETVFPKAILSGCKA